MQSFGRAAGLVRQVLVRLRPATGFERHFTIRLGRAKLIRRAQYKQQFIIHIGRVHNKFIGRAQYTQQFMTHIGLALYKLELRCWTRSVECGRPLESLSGTFDKSS